MPLDDIPSDFVSADRKAVRDQYTRDYLFRVPGADTGAGSQPFVDASNQADAVAPLYRDAELVFAAISIRNAVGQALDAWGERLGGAVRGFARRGVTASSGFVALTTSAGGSNIIKGTTLRYLATNQRYETKVTGVYTTLLPLAIGALSGGPASNLPGGAELQFDNPPVGAAQKVTVITQEDGSGLKGGAPSEDDDSYRKRLLVAIREPPANANESEIVRVVMTIPDLAVEMCWVVPAVLGPATKAVLFTVPPAFAGDSRIPNGAQIAEVEAVVKSACPGDDGIMVAAGADDPFRAVLKVTWKPAAVGWLDEATWPPLVATPVTVSGAVAPTAASARVTSSVAYTAPTAGKNVAFYDPATRTFKQKRVLTATLFAANVYDLTFDLSTLNASDLGFVPVVGSLVSPWSPSMKDLVLPLLQYVGQQGPGEMFASFSDPGIRQRRFPAPGPEDWPSKIENRMVDPLFAVVEDAIVVEPTLPLATTVGTPGVLFYLHTLSDVGVFPE
jgi:uncharacterized phage protein gp47/JayE